MGISLLETKMRGVNQLRGRCEDHVGSPRSQRGSG